MKKPHAALLLALCAIASGCAYVAPGDSAMHRVSADYTASGAVSGVRAYLYGNRTVLELPAAPLMVLIRDESGNAVAFERMGNVFRLARRLDRFTVWSNASSMTFVAARSSVPVALANPPETPRTAAVESIRLPAAVQLAIAPAATSPATAQKPSNADLEPPELVELVLQAKAQLAESRQLLGAARPQITLQAQQAIQAQIDKLEKLLAVDGAATLRFSFATNSTEFSPSQQESATLIKAANAATAITLLGYTDAVVAGPSDARIALGRAQAARDFLTRHGIDKEKVSLFSQKDGAHIATIKTARGRALNRRVEFQFTNRRIVDISRSIQPLVVAK